METPPLTIALLTYNRCHYLREALDAIFRQTYTNYELIVLDNGSTDDTAEMVLAHRDPRLTYVRHPPGNGPEYNGASAQWFARGNRLLGAHDDDILEPTAVEKQMAWMDAEPRLKAVATNACIINDSGEIIQARLGDFQEDLFFEKGKYLEFYLRNKFPMPLSSLMVDTRVVGRKAAKGYYKTVNPKDVFLAGDVFFACMFNALAPVGIIGEPLLRYRLHSGQSSNNMDLVKPELDLMVALERQARKVEVLKKYHPAVTGAILRYTTQNRVLASGSQESLAVLRKEVALLRRNWALKVPVRSRVQDSVLPIEILALLLGLEPILPASAMEESRWPEMEDSCRLAFRAWYRRAAKGESLFSGARKPRRIAVFGSSLVAYLLVLEARRAGVDVVCCLDSNIGRQGASRVLGVPVHPHDWLRTHADEVDAILLSTEGRHGDWVRTLIQGHLGGEAKPMPSWKQFLLGRRAS